MALSCNEDIAMKRLSPQLTGLRGGLHSKYGDHFASDSKNIDIVELTLKYKN